MPTCNERGFTLIEAVVAVSLLAIGVSAVAQLSVVAGRASAVSQQADIIRFAAREKLEQLRSLPFSIDDGAVTVTDVSSDLSTTPPSSTGGSGLAVWPGDTLLSNIVGYCDFLDASGRWLAGGARPPAGAVWVRRWSILPLSGLPDTLLLQVLVVPAHIVGTETVAAARAANAAWLVDIRTRRMR